MAIAPSKLGQFIRMWSGEGEFVRSLREAGLVKPEASDEELISAFRKAREEHEALPEVGRSYNSPNERAAGFLAPYLSSKGRKWAVSLTSLYLPGDEEPDEPRGHRRAWWKFWG